MFCRLGRGFASPTVFGFRALVGLGLKADLDPPYKTTTKPGSPNVSFLTAESLDRSDNSDTPIIRFRSAEGVSEPPTVSNKRILKTSPTFAAVPPEPLLPIQPVQPVQPILPPRHRCPAVDIAPLGTNFWMRRPVIVSEM